MVSSSWLWVEKIVVLSPAWNNIGGGLGPILEPATRGQSKCFAFAFVICFYVQIYAYSQINGIAPIYFPDFASCTRPFIWQPFWHENTGHCKNLFLLRFCSILGSRPVQWTHINKTTLTPLELNGKKLSLALLLTSMLSNASISCQNSCCLRVL